MVKSSPDSRTDVRKLQVILALFGAALAACGCSQPAPTQAGGKPVSHWVQELKNPDAKARRHAVAKLGNVGPADPAVLPALREALNDADAGVRGEAIQALMKCGAPAKDAIPMLTEIQKKDPSLQVREYAGKALERLK
ncbi:MAG: HEAT repeat domain-containing protein [Gemmataceae bacterium]